MNKKRITLLDFLIRAEHSQPYLSFKERLHDKAKNERSYNF